MPKNKGQKPTIIDVFSGAGGLSLGAARAGFTVSAAVELDAYAYDTHKKNFPAANHISADVSELDGTALLKLSNLKKGCLDGLIGGPPCQGFSRIGQRNKGDNRNNLFTHFFRLVSETQPKFFLAENVPGILDDCYDSLRAQALELVLEDYVVLDPIKVTASDYGAPTLRTRVFFIGYKRNYINKISTTAFMPSKNTQKVIVKDALNGLRTKINPEWQTEEKGWRKIGKMVDSEFAERISSFIPDGIGNAVAIKRYRETKEVSGCMGTLHCPEVEARYAALAPGEKDDISKSVRLDPNGFCPTLRAGTGKDKGSYQAVRPIHPKAPRVITPREAARMQGFPDWFVFQPTKWHSFRQIGNSVSPIVAEHLLKVLSSSLSSR